jgi:ABC-type branched-subunit amino acid transport system substrate-binding protein
MTDHAEPRDLALPVLPRRAVVAGVGLASLAGALPAASLPAAASVASRRAVTLGVLTPSVPGRPAVAARGQALVEGLRVGLGPRRSTLLREEVPHGYAGAAAALQRLLDGGADVVVAAVGAPVAEGLEAACRDAGAALVTAGVGAHVVADRGRKRPDAVHNSLQHWASALTLGRWAAAKRGRTMHAVVAAPDAGYDSVFALRRGFTARGGSVVGLTITHNGTDLSDLVADVRRTRPAVVGVSASGGRAVEVVRALRAAGITAPVLLDDLALAEGGLSALGRRGRGVFTAASRVDAELLRQLRAQLRTAGVGPTPYAVLGHDTGLLVAAGLDRLGSRPSAALPRVLAGTRVAGVRGVQVVHPRLGTVSTPLEVRRVRPARATTTRVAKRARVGGAAPAMAVVAGRDGSGYVNEYQTT